MRKKINAHGHGPKRMEGKEFTKQEKLFILTCRSWGFLLGPA